MCCRLAALTEAFRRTTDAKGFARIGAQGTLEAVREAVFAACRARPWWQEGRA